MESAYESWLVDTGVNNAPPSMFTDWNVGVPRPWLQPMCDTFPYVAC